VPSISAAAAQRPEDFCSVVIYFAGRDYEWLRVDGENFAAAQVPQHVVGHADLEAIAEVPDATGRDQ
jgi:hypothetical protein